MAIANEPQDSISCENFSPAMWSYFWNNIQLKKKKRQGPGVNWAEKVMFYTHSSRNFVVSENRTISVLFRFFNMCLSHVYLEECINSGILSVVQIYSGKGMRYNIRMCCAAQQDAPVSRPGMSLWCTLQSWQPGQFTGGGKGWREWPWSSSQPEWTASKGRAGKCILWEVCTTYSKLRPNNNMCTHTQKHRTRPLLFLPLCISLSPSRFISGL